MVQSDPTVFGQSYVARVSSVDGLGAFLGEQLNHNAVAHFQGLGQFSQPGMPVKLPAALLEEVRHSPELVDILEKLKCCTGIELEALKCKRNKIFARLKDAALLSYREKCYKNLQEQRLLYGRMPTKHEPDPLRDAIPERGRIADAMESDEQLDLKSRVQLWHDMHVVLKSSGAVFYRPNESPVRGRCPYCDTGIEEYVLGII